jgi:phosphodiesterase/alkaline phosphatase D-like protein
MTRSVLFMVGLLLGGTTPALAQLVHQGPWSGNVGPNSAIVHMTLNEGRLTSLEVSEHQDFRRPVTTIAQSARLPDDPITMARYLLRNLKPDTTYYVRPVAGRLREHRTIGEFKTFPRAASYASFRVGLASGALTGSEAGAFSEIRYQEPLVFFHLGNSHNEAEVPDEIEAWHALYKQALDSFTQAELYRHVPLVHTWNSRDYGGAAAHAAYRTFMAHYPLPADSPQAINEGSLRPISQAFSIGRVRFIVLDTETHRTDPQSASPTILGDWQWQWLQSELRAAVHSHPLIFLVSAVAWHGREAVSGPDNHWGYYPAERTKIENWLRDEGIGNVCVLSGNGGILAARIGSGQPGVLNEFQAGVLDQRRDPVIGRWTEGPLLPGPTEEFFGIVDVVDNRSRIEVTLKGMNQHGHPRFETAFTIDLSSR